MISLLITNFNTWDLTERCVRSVSNADPRQIIKEIIIVDDCSDAIASSYLKSHSLVHILNHPTNVGYVKCVNIAFNHAKEEICLLLDSDAYLLDDVSPIPLIFEKNPFLGILGFNLVDEHGHSTGNGEYEVDVWSLILGQALERIFRKYIPKRNKRISLFSCGIAVRKKAFEDIQGFDEAFDFLDADHDFSMRMNQSKWQIDIKHGIKIFHKGGGSPQLTSKRVLRFYRNRFKLLKKHKLIKNLCLMKILITNRIYIELLYLYTHKIFHRQEDILSDKIFSRKKILNLVKNEY